MFGLPLVSVVEIDDVAVAYVPVDVDQPTVTGIVTGLLLLSGHR